MRDSRYLFNSMSSFSKKNVYGDESDNWTYVTLAAACILAFSLPCGHDAQILALNDANVSRWRATTPTYHGLSVMLYMDAASRKDRAEATTSGFLGIRLKRDSWQMAVVT